MMKIQEVGGQANARVPTSHIDMICNELDEIEKLVADLTKPLEDLVGLDTLGVDTMKKIEQTAGAFYSHLESLRARIRTLRHYIHYIHSLVSQL